MKWSEIRTQYPKKWLLIEALKAHSEEGRRILDELTVLNTFESSIEAMSQYKDYRKNNRDREYYVLHTDKVNLEIKERYWPGIRTG